MVHLCIPRLCVIELLFYAGYLYKVFNFFFSPMFIRCFLIEALYLYGVLNKMAISIHNHFFVP